MHKWLVMLALAMSACPVSWAGGRAKYPERAVLGVNIVNVAQGLEDVLALPTHRGALIVSITEARPRDQAQDALTQGDLIVDIDGGAVDRVSGLMAIIQTKKPGDRVRVTVLRDGSRVVIPVTLGSAPPLIYLPAFTCPTPTAGSLVGLAFAGYFLLGDSLVALSPSDLSGLCKNAVPACTGLSLMKQSDKRTLIDLNGVAHEIGGDWRRHTHFSRESCLGELERLRAMQERETQTDTPSARKQ